MANMGKYMRYQMMQRSQNNGGEMRSEFGQPQMPSNYGRSEMRGEMRGEGGNMGGEMRNEMRGEMRGRAGNDDLHTAGGDVYSPDHRQRFPRREDGTFKPRNNRTYEMRSHYGGGEEEEEDEWQKPNIIGFDTRIKRGGEAPLNMAKAKEWVKAMRHANGNHGEHWPMEVVKKLMEQKGVEHSPAEVYALMNAMYSDYCEVFKRHGVDSPELYLDMAIAWLDDPDAVKNKAGVYYDCVVKK